MLADLQLQSGTRVCCKGGHLHICHGCNLDISLRLASAVNSTGVYKLYRGRFLRTQRTCVVHENNLRRYQNNPRNNLNVRTS